MASPQTVQPSIRDSYMMQDFPTTTKGTATNIAVSGGSSTNYKKRGTIAFDFSAVVPSGAAIDLATLSLYCETSVASRTITVYRLLRTDWVETEATWNVYKTGSNWGTAGATNTSTDISTVDAATATSVAAGQWLNETVTAQVQTALDSVGGVANFLLADLATNNTNSNYYSSKENATTANRPKLYIEYTDPVTSTCINIGDKQKAIDWAGSKINIGDVWKAIAGVQINVGDTWKTVF